MSDGSPHETDDTPDDERDGPPEDEMTPPDDRSSHERMARYVELAETEQRTRREKRAVLDQVSETVAEAVESAAADTSVGVEVASTSADGRHHTVRARLDRAALVAATVRALPDGFVVEHVNDDGTLTVEWDERETVSDGRQYGSILKATVAEETVTDEDGFVLRVPTRETVLDRAEALDVPRDAAADRLRRLADLDVLDVASDGVYPDTNFSKF
jgi:hypothetical protein